MNVLYSICMRDGVCIVLCACVYCMSLSMMLTYDSLLPLQISISDYSGGTWLTVFQDQAELVLGRKSAEMGQLKEQVRRGWCGHWQTPTWLNTYNLVRQFASYVCVCSCRGSSGKLSQDLVCW